ncbi:DTW domain-containing protein [Baffinella frigidus]|nr:DTW domain-containing protein [Cryptophyta sp. CCMP2293]
MVRAVCMRCNRPEPVCVCSALPAQKIFLNTKIMVLQHPCELRKQIIGTVPLLALCLINFELLIARATASGPPSSTPSEGDPAEAADREGGERATPNNGAFDRLQRNPSLEEALADPGTLLLYPGPGAEDIETMPPMEDGKPRTLIVVDGTWRQAGRVMRETRVLQQAISAGTVRRVQFAHAGSSGYEFRKEPHDFCLSTLESVAYTLRFLERGADGVAAVEALSATFKLMVTP